MEGKGRRVTRCEVTVVTRGEGSRTVRLYYYWNSSLGLFSLMFHDLYPPDPHRNRPRHTHMQRKVLSFDFKKPGQFLSKVSYWLN